MSLWAQGIAPKAPVKQATTIDGLKQRFASSKAQSSELIDNLRSGGGYGNKHTRTAEERFFNAQGELNASTRKEAFEQAEKFHTSYREQMLQKSASQLSPQEYSDMIETSFRDAESRTRFASEMAPLIMERLDYQGFIRQIFHVHEVQQGTQISYERDINATALITHEDGRTITYDNKADRVYPFEFMITAQPEVAVAEVLRRQYDIISRIHDKTTFQIQMKEDRAGLRLGYQAAKLGNNIISIPNKIDKGVLEALSAQIENRRLIMDKYVMHRNDYGDLKVGMNSMEFDPVTSKEMLLSGILAKFWGKPLLVGAGEDKPGQENYSIPKGMVFAVTEGRYFGYMPIRMDLQVMDADKFVFGEVKYSWLFAEMIGMLVTNNNAIACGVKAGASIPSWIK